MQSRSLNTIFLIAACALSTGATAQNTYKCGDTYSQLPCPGGITIDAADPRTSAQKMQADLATRSDARTADAMEKARLQQEKIDLAANMPPMPSVNTDRANTSGTTQAKKNKKAPGYLTAQAAAEKKTKKTVKKSARKKVASKS